MNAKLKNALFLRVGKEYLPMEKISYKEFRKINPRKKGKYLCYFSPGEGYFRIKRENSLPALKKQMEMFLSRKITYSEVNFLKQIRFIGAYFYNNLLMFEEKDVPRELKKWRLTLRNFLTGKKLPTLPSYNLEHKITDFRGKRQNILIGSGLNFLYYWLGFVLEGEIGLKLCQAEGCERVYIQSKGDQKYCSEQCRQRSFQTKKRKREKILK